jgi:hypothetical protein
LSKTEVPRLRSSSSSVRTVRRPTGIERAGRLVQQQQRRCANQRLARPRRCCMPFDICSTRRERASASSTSSSSSSRSAAPPVEPERRWCSSSSSSAEYQPGKRKELCEVADPATCLTGARRRVLHGRGATRGSDEPQGDLHERGLAGAVWPQQADELALVDSEVDSGERHCGPIALLQAAAIQRCRHSPESTYRARRTSCSGRPHRNRAAVQLLRPVLGVRDQADEVGATGPRCLDRGEHDRRGVAAAAMLGEGADVLDLRIGAPA